MKLSRGRLVSLIVAGVIVVLTFNRPAAAPLVEGVRRRGRLPWPLNIALGLSFILSLIWYPEFYARMRGAFEPFKYSERADEMAFLFSIIGWVMLLGLLALAIFA